MNFAGCTAQNQEILQSFKDKEEINAKTFPLMPGVMGKFEE